MGALMPKNPASSLDASNMFDTLYRFPEQVKEAVNIGEGAPLWRQQSTSNRYAFFGLGGSAIGADLLRSYAATTPGADHLNISVHRGYSVPSWMDSDTNVGSMYYHRRTARQTCDNVRISDHKHPAGLPAPLCDRLLVLPSADDYAAVWGYGYPRRPHKC
jgi:hypothetical protein